MIHLEPVPASPGRWRNPAWTDGPGTFAVILGVSAYTHLNGKRGEPPRGTFGLGQLTVSARTAHAFFSWLTNDYARPDSPLAEVWLLLAPTATESAGLPPAVLAHNRIPDLAACQAAIRAWYTAMRDLPLTSAAASRSFLFFSGHGLEIYRDRQILLPADYLAGNFQNDALSTANLVAGVSRLAVPSHTFFIDACRSALTANMP